MEQAQTKLDSLHHVAIQVGDIDRALKWYSEKFQRRDCLP